MEETGAGEVFVNFIRYLLENIVLISHTIPMSIYVAIEVLKWFQVRLISSDRELSKDPKQDGVGLDTNLERQEEKRAANMVRISNTEIIENLGQVDLCICDKTGTLTQNQLTLRKVYTDGKTLIIK